MRFEPAQLKSVMDAVRLDAVLSPVFSQYGVTTYCNIAAYRVVQALGLNLFYNYDADRPMLANEMITFMDLNPQGFSKFIGRHEIAFNLVNKGYLIFAAQKKETHGHICPLYPTDNMLRSGKWACEVPYASNVGGINIVQGLNWCYANIPDYYIVL